MNRDLFYKIAVSFLFIAFLFGCSKENPKEEQQKALSNVSFLCDSLNTDSTRTLIIQLATLPSEAKKLEMLLIKPGTFFMGSPRNERGREKNSDWKSHQVTITKPFYMGKYEITQAQWEALLGKDSHHSYNRGLNNPVEKISWKKCQKFIKALNERFNSKFRLPTEAEWEYACRAGAQSRFSFGDILECDDTGLQDCEAGNLYMWWCGNNPNKTSKEVGLKLPNPWGLYDMHGNVAEWCLDVWEKPYDREYQKDPSGPKLTWLKKIWTLTNHVMRGGSSYYGGRYHTGLKDCRSATRTYEQASDYHYSLGFRIVMVKDNESR